MDLRMTVPLVFIPIIEVNANTYKMLQREFEVIQTLQHPNIVVILDFGVWENALYLVMEFCDGGNVNKLTIEHGGRLPLKIAGPIMMQTLEGFAYAHEQSFIHGDFSMTRILLTGLTPNRTIKVSGFGLRWTMDSFFNCNNKRGFLVGPIPYIPRERVANYKCVKPVSDVWALGTTFYNMLTGQLPREIRRGQDPFAAVLHNPIIPIRERDVAIPAPVVDVIDRSLSENTSDRYKTAAEMHDALAKAL